MHTFMHVGHLKVFITLGHLYCISDSNVKSQRAVVYKIPYRRARLAWWLHCSAFNQYVVCKIPLLAAARPSARATIGYIVYKPIWCVRDL